MSSDPEFSGNRLPDDSGDLFGFAPVAERVAFAVLDQVREQCFVLGLEGEWGSGKSSLLAMLQRRLEERGAPVVRFEPWMVGPREALIPELLGGLDAAIEKLEGATTAAKADSVTKTLRNYADTVGALGRLAGVASALGVPLAGTAAAVLDKASETMSKGVGNTSLTSLKNRSSEALESLSRRIVVLIDDLDRLEPKEAVEVLRLVQSVADFPNVTYVLCYDRARLAESVTQVTGIKDGAAYLEKIVQVVLPVPFPQRSAMRHMFITRLKTITGRTELDERLSDVILNHIGSRLRTPRAIVRALDGLSLLWPALMNEVDLTDLVWLQLVRNEDVQLYRWIEEYVAEAVDLPTGMYEADAVRSRLEGSLSQLLSPNQPLGLNWKEVGAFLPMVSDVNSSPKAVLLTKPSQSEALRFYNSKRLSSPDHARLYFGLLKPEGAMTDAEMASFLEICKNPEGIAQELLRLGRAPSHAGVTRLEIILDQLGTAFDRMDENQIRGLVMGLLSIADELVISSLVTDQTVFRQSLGRILSDISTKRDLEVWHAWLSTALEQAQAVNFLTNEVDVQKDQISLGWADGSLPIVLQYLSAQYAKADPSLIVESRIFSKILNIWASVDISSVTKFLEDVFHNDELLYRLILNLYKHLVERSAFGGLGEHVFRASVQDIFGAMPLSARLRGIANTSPYERDGKIVTILAILETT